MAFGRGADDTLMTKLVGRGSRKGSTPAGRVGDALRRPPAWVAIAGIVATLGPKGRQAALRGTGCYLAAVAAHMPLKAVIGRSHPKGAGLHSLGPFTSSFPSGHAAADLAFTLGAAQVMPVLAAPLSAATLLAEWALVRNRAHYVTDLVAGAGLGVVVALTARKLWPVKQEEQPDEGATPFHDGEHLVATPSSSPRQSVGGV